jgi:hypothetical protein
MARRGDVKPIDSGTSQALVLRFEGRKAPNLIQWDFEHPNSFDGRGQPRGGTLVDRSELRPLLVGKLSLISFLLLSKLWDEIRDKSASQGDFFWEGAPSTPANTLWELLHKEKQGWVVRWFGYAPPGAHDGSRDSVAKLLATVLIKPQSIGSRKPKDSENRLFMSRLIGDPDVYVFDKNVKFSPLRPGDIQIEWESCDESPVTDPDRVLALTLSALAQGTWKITTRQQLRDCLRLPESLIRWLGRPVSRIAPDPVKPPADTEPAGAFKRARVSLNHFTMLAFETENIQVEVQLRAYGDRPQVSSQERKELIAVLESYLGKFEISAENRGSLTLTLALSKSQASMLATVTNEGLLDAFAIDRIEFLLPKTASEPRRTRGVASQMREMEWEWDWPRRATGRPSSRFGHHRRGWAASRPSSTTHLNYRLLAQSLESKYREVHENRPQFNLEAAMIAGFEAIARARWARHQYVDHIIQETALHLFNYMSRIAIDEENHLKNVICLIG